MYKRHLLLSFLLLLFLPTRIYANSSWHWISATRPIDILLYVIIASLIIESIVILRISRSLYRTLRVVCLANCVSFLIPYLSYFLPNELGVSGYEYFIKMINHWPSFIIGVGYLSLTILVEVPIVYFFLEKDCTNRRELLIRILIANTFTTTMVFFLEKALCFGQW